MHLSCKTGQLEMHSRPSEAGRPVFGRNRNLRQSLMCKSSSAVRFSSPLDRDSKFWRLSMQRLVKVEGSITPSSSGKETVSAAGHAPTILISGGKPPSGMDVRATESEKLNS
ncbi:uncharacterized protein LOC111313701 [Durio zibethinus]|uniref:Uncharacterized protein LOC111313701 n=1 Tax=Durio zibethinus TaxID=66656 RepID=A0A6P6AZA6_DURZI|nr:uncharacterized protein LOC111313701 [Durio zibethinus]